MSGFQGGRSYCFSETSAAVTADACEKKKRKETGTFALPYFFQSRNHLFSLTGNVIISPLMWFTVAKERRHACA